MLAGWSVRAEPKVAVDLFDLFPLLFSLVSLSYSRLFSLVSSPSLIADSLATSLCLSFVSLSHTQKRKRLTMCPRCSRKVRTVSKISKRLCVSFLLSLICSSSSSAMYVPVRPMPAEQWTKSGPGKSRVSSCDRQSC